MNADHPAYQYPFDNGFTLGHVLDKLNMLFLADPECIEKLFHFTVKTNRPDLIPSDKDDNTSARAIINYLFGNPNNNNRVAEVCDDETEEMYGFCKYTGNVYDATHESQGEIRV